MSTWNIHIGNNKCTQCIAFVSLLIDIYQLYIYILHYIYTYITTMVEKRKPWNYREDYRHGKIKRQERGGVWM